MGRVLIIYYSEPGQSQIGQTLHRAYSDSMDSLSRFSSHECLRLNAARLKVPQHIRRFEPDLVVFHCTFIQRRIWPDLFRRMTDLVSFVQAIPAAKVLITSDESWFTDQLVAFIHEFGVAHVFTFASPQAQAVIYDRLNSDQVTLTTVLSDYIDDRLCRRMARMRAHNQRTLDVGARLPTSVRLGSHGQERTRLVEVFERAAQARGWTADISNHPIDHLRGNDWLRFLLQCRYVLGNETGASVIDRDGSQLACIEQLASTHGELTFEEAESACYPGLDGSLDYRCLAPRHLEAVLAKTCQVLIEGDYSGVLKPGEHYIELKRDFSNLEQVLQAMDDEDARVRMVERAYRDVVESGRFSYRGYAMTLLGESLRGIQVAEHRVRRTRLAWNRTDNRLWPLYPAELLHILRSDHIRVRYASWLDSARESTRVALWRLLRGVLGEARLRKWLAYLRGDRA